MYSIDDSHFVKQGLKWTTHRKWQGFHFPISSSPQSTYVCQIIFDNSNTSSWANKRQLLPYYPKFKKNAIHVVVPFYSWFHFLGIHLSVVNHVSKMETPRNNSWVLNFTLFWIMWHNHVLPSASYPRWACCSPIHHLAVGSSVEKSLFCTQGLVQPMILGIQHSTTHTPYIRGYYYVGKNTCMEFHLSSLLLPLG